MIKTTFRRGFTLIELMIVIVILGVLMGTILPRLTGAQARARDTGRIADLNTIGQALETYFDDNGQYPGIVGSVYCLDKTLTAGTPTAPTGLDIINNIKDYLKGGIVPAPAPSQVTSLGAGGAGNSCKGAYIYVPLQNKGIAGNGYALFTDVETYQKANILGDTVSSLSTTSDTTDISGLIVTDMAALKTADNDSAGGTKGAANTIYVLYN